jgi:hypothetical protein
MQLLGLNKAVITVLQGTKVELYKIPRDRTEGERLVALAREFWEEFVVKKVEP